MNLSKQKSYQMWLNHWMLFCGLCSSSHVRKTLKRANALKIIKKERPLDWPESVKALRVAAKKILETRGK